MTAISIVLLVVKPIVDTILKEITKDVYSSIKEEYLLVSGVEKQVKRLSSSLTAIQGVLEDAQKKQLNDASLRDWLGKLKNAALDAEDTLGFYKTEAYLWRKKQQQRTFPSRFKNGRPPYKHDAAHNMKEICERIETIAKEKGKFHLVVSSNPERPHTSPANPERPHTVSSLDKSDVVGRVADKEKIVNMLLSNQTRLDPDKHPNVIPIIGMGGLGKTTLAQLVVSDERITEHFEFRMWVCVTVNFDLTRILKEIIEYLTKTQYDINLSKDQLVSRLLDIMKGKHFLLVLDDVWTENHLQWKELQGFLKQGENGSSVLVTSRSIKVSDAMGTKPPHLLSNLPEEECWSLFKKFAFNSTAESSGVQTDLEKIGKEIVHKCNGLPLAIKAMGGLLHGNDDVREWQIISNSEIWEIEEQDQKIFHKILPVLKLSYDHLPSHLQECFAYCSIFPKAYVFDKKELVKLWMAEALIQSRERVKPEDIGNNYFNELSFKSFFQLFNVENKERYRMHDYMHDLAKSISIPHDINTCNTAENTRHLSILCTDVEQPALKIIDESKKLRTLLLPGEDLKDLGKNTLNKLFNTLRYMRVLDLSSSSIVELPEAVEKLKLLRYLDLSRTEIRKLPNSICNLINLQTLKLLGCRWLFMLPTDLGNLSNLRHLELDEMFWYKCSKLPPRLGGLTSLHNLNAFRVGRDKGYGIDELKDMAYLMGTLQISDLQNVVDDDAKEAKLREKESLQKVVFEWSGSSDDVTLQQDHKAAQEKVLDDLQPHANIKELQIRNYKGHSFAPWIRDGLLQNLVSISFKHCTKCKTLSLGQLPRLVQLCINGMLELEEWPEIQRSSLRTLKVSNCPKLNTLPLIFPNLRVMKIKRCNSLKALAVNPSLEFLILVDNPVLEGMQETLCPYNRLTELKIVNCNNLRALPNMSFSLQKLEISGCELLSALPTPQFPKGLQHLALGPCHDGTLVNAIPSTSSLDSLVISGISNVSSLSKWPRLPGLKALYIRECKDLVSLSEGEGGGRGGGGDEKEEKGGREGEKEKEGEGGEGPSRRVFVIALDFQSCTYFSSLEEEEDEEEEEKWPLKSLASLKLLSIRDCSKLETLSSQGLPSELECLTVSSCPNLKSLGSNDMLKSLTSLKDLYVENCLNLQSLPEDGLPTSLQHLHIKECPLLAKRCHKENGGGPDWPKIMHVPDIEIDYTIISSVTNSPKNMQAPNTIKPSKPKVSSTTWISPFMCGRETDIKEEGKQKKQIESQSGSVQKDKGKFSKGKMTQGESSSSASQRK